MINALYYKNLILDCAQSTEDFPAIIDGRITGCDYNCAECGFNVDKNSNCTVNFIKWLYEEATETGLFTDAEINFLSLLSEGYIMRTQMETFLMKEKEFPYGAVPTDGIICISESYGLFFKSLTPYVHYSIQELKEKL